MDSKPEIPETDTKATERDGTEHRPGFWAQVWDLYYDGFRSMTVGKTLWIIILVKLFVIFVVMKLLFFPNLLNSNFDNDEDRANHVRQELINRE